MQKPLEVDYTSLSSLDACPRLFYNRFELGIIPVDRPPPIALAFGKAIHGGLELLDSDGLEAALSKFDELYTAEYESEGWDDSLRTPYIGRVLIHAYHQKFGRQPYQYLEIGAAIEVDDVIYYGRLDKIADDGLSTVIDRKTSSGILWLPQARLNWQLIGYAHMARELTGVDPQQVAIDGLIVPRMSKKLDPTKYPPEAEHALTIHDNLHYRDARIYPRDYAGWHEWLRWGVRRINEFRESGVWPKNAPVACSRYNRICEYNILCCAQDEEQEQRIREALFIEDRWHPFEEA